MATVVSAAPLLWQGSAETQGFYGLLWQGSVETLGFYGLLWQGTAERGPLASILI